MDDDDDPLLLTQFFFREILKGADDPCASSEIKRLWEEYGEHRDDCALALLELQSRLDLSSPTEVDAAAAALIAAAISAQGRDELDRQIQLSRTLEMIASKTSHEEASHSIFAALREHELLFDPELLMLPEGEVGRRRDQRIDRNWLGYPAQREGSLFFLDEFASRGPVHELQTRARSRANHGSQWTPAAGPTCVDAYGFSWAERSEEEALVLVRRTRKRSTFLEQRNAMHELHHRLLEMSPPDLMKGLRELDPSLHLQRVSPLRN